MKILHINMGHPYNPVFFGGAEIRNKTIYNILASKGHDIYVLSNKFKKCSTYNNLFKFKYEFVGINCKPSIFYKIVCSLTFSIVSFWWLLRNFKKFDVIIEELTVWSPSFSFIIVGKYPFLQIQGWTALSNLLNKNKFFGLMMKAVMTFYPKCFKRHIVINSTLNHRYGIKGVVVPQGVDKELFKIDLVASQNLIGFLGRLDLVQKGLDLLLEALRFLKDRGLLLTLLIGGDGPDAPKLMKMAEAMGIRSQLIFCGWVERGTKEDFFRQIRFLVVPSRYEGQAIVVLEAAATGRPVIVSDINELKYAVENGFGISFKSGSAKELAMAIEKLWKDTELCVQMGKNGRKYAMLYTWERVAELFEQALQNNLRNNYNIKRMSKY